MEGANISEELALLPVPNNQSKIYQHPHQHSTHVHSAPITKAIPVAIPMEMDAIYWKKSDDTNPFTAVREICIQQGLCFHCLEKFKPSTHMVNGKKKCPNKNAIVAKKFALLKPTTTKTSNQLAAIEFEDVTKLEDLQALTELG